MTRIKVSSGSRIRLFFANSSFRGLLVLWMFVYLATGVLFAAMYMHVSECAVTTSGGACVDTWFDLLYFSLTTQSTIGYGDLTPQGWGRALSALQGLVGITMNSVLLGIAVVKALKRTTPIVFADYLVYDLANHCFWLRFINVDPDQLREVQIKMTVSRALDAAEAAGKPYDTLANSVKLPFAAWAVRESLNLTALKSVWNGGQSVNILSGNDATIVLSPRNFESDALRPQTPKVRVSVELHGYFEATGDQFFASKVYDVRTIRCGQFDIVNNYEIADLSARQKAKFISSKLNATIPSSPDACRECPFHATCIFDVAAASRGTRLESR